MSWVVRADGSGLGMIADAEEVRRALGLFGDPEFGVEVMALRSGACKNIKGSDLDGLMAAVKELPSGAGLYFRVNPVKAGLAKPAKNDDVIRRRWVYIDVDPLKDEANKDNSATDDEKAKTSLLCDTIHEYLYSFGWPAPVVVDSGNGYGLFYRCEFSVDKKTTAVYRRLLASLNEKFKDQGGVIDKSVHNLNRLAKIPGTWARKGAQSDDRPHRPCKFQFIPEVIEEVNAEQFAAAAGVETGEPKQDIPYTPTPSANGHHENRETRYARRAMDQSCARVAMSRSPAQGGDGRNNALNKAAYNLGHFVGAGKLERGEVERRLFEAACHAGLDRDDGGERAVHSTIERGVTAGIEKPWTGFPEEARAYIGEAKAETNGEATPSDSVIYWASSVTPRLVEWLWPGRIPLGKLTTFAGNGGLGKTFVLCDVIARITQGDAWPDSAECAPEGKCLFISGEDDPEDTLVPRMIELGADTSKIAFLTTATLNKFTLADLKTLDKAMAQMGDGVRFVAIDPPTAYLGGVDDHKNAELRGLLTPLMLWAKHHRVAVVFNTHVNKPQGAKVEAMMRVMGSVAWVNAMRSAYMFAKDPEDPTRRLFAGMKSNLGGEKKALAYRIAATQTLAKVEWLGEVDTTADEAVNREKPNRKRSVAAGEWLAEMFSKTDKLKSKVIWDAMKATTISSDALKEAREEMGIKAKQEADPDGERCWFMYWPQAAREAWSAKLAESEVQGSEVYPP